MDDEESVRDLLTAVLEDDPVTVETANTGEEGLEMAMAASYDLIISDSGMPVLSGPELYLELERREPHLAQRFVFVTGDVLNSSTRAFLEQTGAPQLEKPFTLESVKRVVRRALLATA